MAKNFIKHKQKTKKLSANLWGTHATRAAWLNPKRKIRGLYITQQALASFEDILDKRKTPPSLIEKTEMDRLLPKGAVHQGIALHVEPLEECFIQDLIIQSKERKRTIFLMLDQVTDPHNVGAIMRSACAFGASGIIMQKKHSPELTGTLAKTATGAVEHIDVAYEINLSRALEALKKAGFTAYGLDEHAQDALGTTRLPEKLVLVLGAEGKGLRPKVAEHCDALLKLPTTGPIQSLNVSNAAAIALFAASLNNQS
jgi:23S rRNA (guanosine2251-2'-O)-methyltransferase